MRKFTTEYTVYSFDELNEEAKRKALEEHVSFLSETLELDYITEGWQARLEELGYNNPQISWSGFWSQGDGASFTADIDLREWLKAHKLANKYRTLYNVADEVSADVERIDHMYSHENTVRASIYGAGESDKEQAQSDEVEALIQQEVHELSRKIYRNLEDEYDYQTSEEVAIESIEANEYEFYEDGRLA